jgi:hypothetical protein
MLRVEADDHRDDEEQEKSGIHAPDGSGLDP